ncbi:MAG: L-threonylcarbamoyladenylate synthase [Nitrospirota bacterium]|nr:L-threonylcarbamoyladenylate synthase [Nitrospirota bacterium]
MEILRPSESGMDKAIRRLRQLLDNAEIIAYPTETFYGLGTRYDSEDSLERLYNIKKRPHEKAMPLIIGRTALLSLLTPVIPEVAERLMERFWPGPLTLIFEARENLSLHITAGSGKVAVRIPGPSFALDLASHLDYPITSTSANMTGMPPAETAAQVMDYFDTAPITIVDCGKTPGNAPSTIVDVTGSEIRIVRQGMISSKAIISAVQL